MRLPESCRSVLRARWSWRECVCVRTWVCLSGWGRVDSQHAAVEARALRREEQHLPGTRLVEPAPRLVVLARALRDQAGMEEQARIARAGRERAARARERLVVRAGCRLHPGQGFVAVHVLALGQL